MRSATNAAYRRAAQKELARRSRQPKSRRDAFFRREHYHSPQRELVAAIANTAPDAARLITELASRQSG